MKQLPQPYLQIALLVLAVLLMYGGSLHAPLLFDDSLLFDSAGNLEKNINLGARGLPNASLIWTVKLLGNEVTWLRLGNVLLHAANVLALFFLLKRLFRITLGGKDSSGSAPASLTWFAFFAALLFALHPVAVYGVAYLIQRTTLMATLFVLLMLNAYLTGLLRGGWRWMVVAVLCYFAALYSKEHSIMAPAAALAMTLLVRRPSAQLLKQLLPYALLLLVIAATAAYLFYRWGIVASAYEPNAIGMLNQLARTYGIDELPNVYLLSILTQAALFFKYLGLWLIPNPAWMSVDMRDPFAMALFGWHTLGLLAFIGYFCGAVWLLLKQGRLGLLGFALLFPWLMFLTEFSTIRAQEPFVLYRSYLWLPGLFAALPVVYGWLAPKPGSLGRTGIIALAAVALVLVPLTLNRLNTFSSALLLWDDAEKLVRDNPRAFGAERIYFNRGTELGQLKRYDEAIADFGKAIALHPFDFEYGNRAAAYLYSGRYQEALLDYNHAITLNPNNPNSYNGRALAYRALGDFAAAQQDFSRACSLGVCAGNY